MRVETHTGGSIRLALGQVMSAITDQNATHRYRSDQDHSAHPPMDAVRLSSPRSTRRRRAS
jgi:hypothetical protein